MHNQVTYSDVDAADVAAVCVWRAAITLAFADVGKGPDLLHENVGPAEVKIPIRGIKDSKIGNSEATFSIATVLGRKQYIGSLAQCAHQTGPKPRMVPPPPNEKFCSGCGALRNALFEPYVAGSGQIPSSAPGGNSSARCDMLPT